MQRVKAKDMLAPKVRIVFFRNFTTQRLQKSENFLRNKTTTTYRKRNKFITIPSAMLAAKSNTLLQIDGTRISGQDVRDENVNAVVTIQQIMKTSLGPQGLDKMLVDDIGDVTSKKSFFFV